MYNFSLSERQVALSLVRMSQCAFQQCSLSIFGGHGGTTSAAAAAAAAAASKHQPKPSRRLRCYCQRLHGVSLYVCAQTC